MTREEATKLIHNYALEYAEYVKTGSIKPPVNPVIKIMGKMEDQVAYWKLSFKMQCEMSAKRSNV